MSDNLPGPDALDGAPSAEPTAELAVFVAEKAATWGDQSPHLICGMARAHLGDPSITVDQVRGALLKLRQVA
jgi:hypothetical protein